MGGARKPESNQSPMEPANYWLSQLPVAVCALKASVCETELIPRPSTASFQPALPTSS